MRRGVGFQIGLILPMPQAFEMVSPACYTLTPLGRQLASLPLDPRLGKMLLLGSLCGCLDLILTVAAVLAASRPVFFSPRERQVVGGRTFKPELEIHKSLH